MTAIKIVLWLLELFMKGVEGNRSWISQGLHTKVAQKGHSGSEGPGHLRLLAARLCVLRLVGCFLV